MKRQGPLCLHEPGARSLDPLRRSSTSRDLRTADVQASTHGLVAFRDGCSVPVEMLLRKSADSDTAPHKSAKSLPAHDRKNLSVDLSAGRLGCPGTAEDVVVFCGCTRRPDSCDEERSPERPIAAERNQFGSWRVRVCCRPATAERRPAVPTLPAATIGALRACRGVLQTSSHTSAEARAVRSRSARVQRNGTRTRARRDDRRGPLTCLPINRRATARCVFRKIRSNHAGTPQSRNLSITLSQQLRQYLVGVLPEYRRCMAIFDRGLREADRVGN